MTKKNNKKLPDVGRATDVGRTISFYDLFQKKEIKLPYMKGDIKEFDKQLFRLGFDVKRGYEIVTDTHRPLTRNYNPPWYGPRIVGYERADKRWINSEWVSWEMKMATSEKSLVKELNQMSRELTYQDQIGLNNEMMMAEEE